MLWGNRTIYKKNVKKYLHLFKWLISAISLIAWVENLNYCVFTAILYIPFCPFFRKVTIFLELTETYSKMTWVTFQQLPPSVHEFLTWDKSLVGSEGGSKHEVVKSVNGTKILQRIGKHIILFAGLCESNYPCVFRVFASAIYLSKPALLQKSSGKCSLQSRAVSYLPSFKCYISIAKGSNQTHSWYSSYRAGKEWY